MDAGAYVDEALQLVDHRLESHDDLLDLLVARAWLRDRATAADLGPLRRLQEALVEIVDRSSTGDENGVVTRVNALLEEHPVRPRISGHDAQSWHLHVTRVDEPVSDILAGEAAFGLALLVTEVGADRLGRCAAPGCGRAFLDTSSNRARRFCSQRCATRVNVAAHRSRAKAT